MRVRSAWGIACGVAASGAVSAVAFGQSGHASTWGAAPSPSAPVADAGASAAASGAGAPAHTPGSVRSTWGSGPAVVTRDAGPGESDEDDAEEEEEDDDTDAGAPSASTTDGGDSSQDGGAWAPTEVGLSVGLRGPGYGIPFGTANGGSLQDLVVYGMVPITIDAGWFFSPSFYLGGYISYGFGINAGYQNTAVCNGAVDDCSATVVRVGMVAHWHFRPKTAFDPWIGAGLGYEEIIAVDTSVDDGSTDLSHGLPAIEGLVETGFDIKPLRYLGVGPYVQASGGTFVVTDSGWHGWLTFGMRFRTNL